MRIRARLGFLCLSWSIICLSAGVKIGEVLRRRRQTCENGSYKHGQMECCRCPAGFYVKEHCTANGTSPTCGECPKEYYRDRPNSMQNCEPCTVCQEQSNRRVQRVCTRSADTVCTCLEDHYCEQGDKCKVCHRCDQCQESSVKVACTVTNNTVCYEKGEGSTVAAVVSIGTVLLVAAVVAAFVFYLRKKKKYCFETMPETSEEEEVLHDDVDLTPVLSDIAQHLGWRAVKDAAVPLVSHVEIENVQRDHPKDTAEQTEQLLRTWYQKHGLRGAYKELVRKLNKKGHRAGANGVKRIVEEQLRNV